MTIPANPPQGWADPVPQIRIPHWLSKDDRMVLSETIIDLCQTATVFPAHRAHLDAVLTELGVAEARDQMWPSKSEIVRRAYGYGPDVLPIRMSDEEREAVLTITRLPKDLRDRLNRNREKK